MSYSVNGTTITLTRGDTFMATVSITNPDGSEYVPVDGDVIRFALKESYDDEDTLSILKKYGVSMEDLI